MMNDILKGSVEGRRKYLFRCDFSSCSESAEIWHADSFCVKKCSCGFFSRQKNINQITRKSPLPLCPSPNIVGFRSLRTKTPCMCVFYTIGWGEGGGGGGGRRGVLDFQECVWSLVSPLVEKKHGHFLTQKESACQISANSEQLEKSQRNRYLPLPSTQPFYYCVIYFVVTMTALSSEGQSWHVHVTIFEHLTWCSVHAHTCIYKITMILCAFWLAKKNIL